MVPQNLIEGPLNITSILNIFKSFIKQLYQKLRMQNITKKKAQNTYFRAEISDKQEQLIRLKVKKKIDF